MIEPPTVLGEKLRTLEGYCWISVNGTPAHVMERMLEVEVGALIVLPPVGAPPRRVG